MTKKLPSIHDLIAMGCKGVTEDSREVKEGYLFVALRGERESGIDYVTDAIARGARFVLSLEKLPSSVAQEGIQSFVHNEPRHCLAKLAKHFTGPVPQNLFAITGTSGKTSCSIFVTQLLRLGKRRACYAGTLGFDEGLDGTSRLLQGKIFAPNQLILQEETTNLTSERACVLYPKLNEAYLRGINYAVLEASSIGISQCRLDGLRFKVGAITSFGDDHLETHGNIEAYRQAKLRLFRKCMHKNARIVAGRGMKNWLQLDGDEFDIISMDGKNPEFGYKVLKKGGRFSEVEVWLPKQDRTGVLRTIASWPNMPSLQYDNLIVAMAMLVAMGDDPYEVIALSQYVQGIRGRFEQVAATKDGKRIFVDYAHNGFALESVLRDLRSEIVMNGTLHVVFGAGGDRDVLRRQNMGKIAAQYADHIIVTDDNPRTEDPANIRKMILAHTGTKAREIPNREDAILHAVSQMKANDILLIAGKGDEDLILRDKKIPYDDRSFARKAFNITYPKEQQPFDVPYLFAKDTLNHLFGKSIREVKNSSNVTGVSIDTRTLKEGDAFIAIEGENHNGHAYIAAAYEKGAKAIIARDVSYCKEDSPVPVYQVKDSLAALWDLARSSRGRKVRKVIGITGSVGKTSCRQAVNKVLSKEYRCYASQGNLNNHFGLPLSLARTPYQTDIGIYEAGIDSPDEMPPMAELLAPDVAIFTAFSPSHTERLGSIEGVIKAKLQLLSHMREGADVILPAEAFEFPKYRDVLKSHLKPYKNKFNFRYFGFAKDATDRVIQTKQVGEYLYVEAELFRKGKIRFALNAVGVNWALTGLIGMMVGEIFDIPAAFSVLSLRLFLADYGRGRLIQTNSFKMIDHSYNASPASMKSAIDSLMTMPITEAGNRFVILGDMEDLGETSHAYHVKILEAVNQTNIDGCFLVGDRFRKALADCSKLSRQRFIEHSGDYSTLAKILKSILGDEDILMIKGSRKFYLDKLVSMLA